MTNKEWFPQAKFGMMIHFGLYSLLGGEWKGQRTPGNAEWLQNYLAIPGSEYSQLTRIFNPIYFNAEEWVTTAKEAGMEYFVVTSKHHEGFALFRSEYDDFNCCTGTPFGRDIIAELGEACYKHGLKFGLYYSQEVDWHEPNGGGYLLEPIENPLNGRPEWDLSNYWDYPDAHAKDFTQCFETKIKTQFKEILTGYGDLCLIWCDTPGVITNEQSMELYNMIKQYQPDCLINSRIGNGVGDYHATGDNQVDFEAEGNTSAVVGNRTGLYECPGTTMDSWGYKADCVWKSAEDLKAVQNRLNSKGINYLLNIGPDHLGRLPKPAVDILKKMREL